MGGPRIHTLGDVVDPWTRILEGNLFSLFESEHGGKQVMFGISRVMLDLWVNSSFGEKFVRTSEVVLAWDMLLKKSRLILGTSECALNTVLVTENAL